MGLAVLLVDPLHEVFLGVVDDVVRADLLQALQLAGELAQAITSAPASFEEHRAGAHPPEAPRTRMRSFGWIWPMVYIMRIARGDGQAGRVLEAHLGGQPHEVVRRHARTGEAAGAHLADEPARADPVDRVDHHALADFPVADVGAERDDLAGEVEAHDRRHRHLDARHAAAREDVVVVQRAGAHAYQRLSGPGHRVRVIGLVLDRAGPPCSWITAAFIETPSLPFVPKPCDRPCWCRRAAARTRRTPFADAGTRAHWRARSA